MKDKPRSGPGPLRVGLFYGFLAGAVSVFSHFFFFLLDPETMTDWVLAAITNFIPLASIAAYIFLGILAAVRARPTYLDSGVPYRSLLLRDAALAAALVALVAGLINIVSTGLQATVFADDIRNFATEAAPKIVSYVNEVRADLSDPPPPANIEQMERILQPPALSDLGQTIGNTAIGTMLLGALGGVIGGLRGLGHRKSETPNPDEDEN
ncbi:hypothetical protein [Rubrobacter indicoceani]|uniref:hypothetical protein n=1 Tax=Rubrobacter indicoceani TaxID=2051957 RepID=UPI000E5BCE3A|nr:hypothetical protein [Rubrobacter indicoceani]